MIVQEIKLYEEAYTVKVVGSTSANGNPVESYNGYSRKVFTAADLQVERNRAAANNIKIGSRFRYIKGSAEIEIVSYETDPKKCEDIEGSPAILKAKRTSPMDILTTYDFHYTVDELIDTAYLERI